MKKDTMDINCDKCNSRFRVADEKIPSELKFIACPKCKNKIPINTTIKTDNDDLKTQDEPAPNSINEARLDESFSFDEAVSDESDTDKSASSESYDAADKPFDFIEEEGKTALVCESDPAFRKTIQDTLNLMEYTITVAKNGRDVMKKMRYHVYDVIILNEKFENPNPDANPVLFNLERLPISTRRNIFVTLLSDRFRTMDNMTAFQKSVNLIINLKNINDFGKIFSRGLTDHEFFYKVFRDTMKKIGRV
ncbi:MAG: zinc-ribbon domain-containing protein [Proteobacteria bacterium]|nr:zinc-ribbon domain-containing protein [Pseudomonadota bacterium]